MKTHKNLYAKICHIDNLFLAAKKAQKGKRFNTSVAHFNMRLESELFQLEEELNTQTYTAGAYKTFWIFDPKKRMISAAPYRDRVVHHALCNIIEPIFERGFIYDSYANRKGKGTHLAIKRFQYFSRKFKYVLKCDIRKYFPSIDHEILKREINRKIACKKTQWLIDSIIDNSNPQEETNLLFPNDDLFTNRKKGLPIGNLSSQYFANIYLDRFDHFVKEQLQCKGYIRYVDDFVLFHNQKEKLHDWHKQIEAFLLAYRLQLHKNKSKVFPVKVGIPFLGFRIFPAYKLLKKENVKNAKKRLKQKIECFKKGKITDEKLEQSINSWMAHANHGNTFLLQNKMINFIKQMEINLIRSPSSSWRVLEQQTEQLSVCQSQQE